MARRPRPRDPGLVVVLLAAVLLSVAYGLWAWQRHRWYLTSGYDLGIFDQATRHLARLEAPASSLRETPNLWGDHLHPIIVLWGLLRALWPSPVALLTAQAVLVSAAMVPLYLVARDRAGRVAGVLLALAYGTSWGVQRAIDFDVHELAFAPALLAAAVLFADRRRWPAFWVAAVLLLCVKEDVALLVAALGLWLVLTGERRRGAVAIVLGLGWLLAATRWWIPALGDEPYAYWTYGALGDGPLGALGGLLLHPWRLVTVGLDPAVKVGTLAALLAPFLFVTPWLTRLAVLPLPLLAERLLSDQPVLWQSAFHYNLLPTMALALASAGGIATLQRWAGGDRRRRAAARPRSARRWLPAGLAGAGLVLGTAAWFPVYGAQGDAATPPLAAMATLDPPPRIVDRHTQDRVVAATPATGSVAAPRTLQPHLTGRGQDVFLLEGRRASEPPHVAMADTVLLDLTDPSTGTVSRPAPLGPVTDALTARIDRGGLVPVWSGPEGWVVLRAPGAPGGARPDPRLGTIAGDDARRARRAVAAWGRALSAAAPCGAACDAATTTGLAAAARREQAALVRASAASPGTCRRILRDVAGADLDVLRRLSAGRRPGATALDRDRATQVADGRLTGATRRALLVCAPGTRLPPPPVLPGGAWPEGPA